MTKKSIPVTLILYVFLHTVYLQAQPMGLDYIRQKLQAYCKTVPREEIFIQTDREEYISGEELWFNLFLIDRQSLKPSSGSKLAYFEILNPENKPVIQKRILIEGGSGPGQTVLPDTLKPGTYTVRAYTNWMKNFFPYNCFVKDINIYNPLNTRTFTRSERLSDSAGSHPESPTAGLILTVNNLQKDTLEISIFADARFRSEADNLLYLLIQTRGNINYLSKERILQDITKISIPKDTLSSGINQITFFNSDGPVAERYIYTPPKSNLSIDLQTTDSCKQRDKVNLGIEIGNGSSVRPGLTNFSISVALAGENPEIPDLTDYLIFGTEFGSLPFNEIRGQRILRISPERLDSLLLSAKSNWIDWDKILSPGEYRFKYPMEKNEHYFSGQLITNNLQPAYGGEVLLLSVPGKEPVFQYTNTDSDGDFNFRIHIDEEVKDLIIQPDIQGKFRKITTGTSFSDQYQEKKIFIDSINVMIPSFILQQCINFQIRRVFGSSSEEIRMTPVLPAPEKKRFYGKPDFELIMKNFIMLDSMQEVFFELIPRIELESKDSGFEMALFDPQRKRTEGSPVVMIDGVIIRDMSAIANLDPDLVEKIDVIWDKYRVGSYIFNGVVNLITKTGDFSCVPLPSDAVRLKYRVIDTVFSFISPDYSAEEVKNDRTADYRNTLYWNPSVLADENGKAHIEFWTSDNKGDFLININGISSEGKTVSSSKRLMVR